MLRGVCRGRVQGIEDGLIMGELWVMMGRVVRVVGLRPWVSGWAEAVALSPRGRTIVRGESRRRRSRGRSCGCSRVSRLWETRTCPS